MRKRLFIFALAVIAAANSLAFAQEEPKCLDVTPSALKEGEILFLYGSEADAGMLETIVLFDGTDFKEAYNRYFRGITEAFRVDDGKTFPISLRHLLCSIRRRQVLLGCKNGNQKRPEWSLRVTEA